MRIETTHIAGPAIVHLEPFSDDRGFFARTFCVDEFKAAGLETDVMQANMSYNKHAGTLRGMHYQDMSAPEAKLIRCVRGAVWDCIIDMRPDSATYRQHVAVELTAENRTAFFVPPMFAHGFITLTDDAEVMYQVSGKYSPDAEHGVRYNDPAIGITWPREVAMLDGTPAMSDKDASWPLLEG